MIFQRFLTVTLAVAVMILALGVESADAASRKKSRPKAVQDRSAEIVIDATTGQVLNARNADKKLHPASLTKMMALYLTFDALQKGTLTKNQRIYVSKRAAQQEPSSLGLKAGETIRVEDAILSIATKSANDSAVVLAEAVGGSEPRFARMMTLKARQLGMANTNFVNASGLHSPAQVSTARDMAVLSQALIRNHPRHYRYFSTTSFKYKGNTYGNHNRLMTSYRGMDGLKTGYIHASGYNLASSAVRDGKRLIGVVFGGKTTRSRNNTMAQILNRGFANVDSIRTAAKSPLPARKPVIVIPDSPEVLAAAESSPQFDAMGLAMRGLAVDQGDTGLYDERPVARNFISDFRPRPLNTAAHDGWAIQVGAFSSHSAGEKALQSAKKNLRGAIHGVDSIAPLMTNRGMVYRARLSGLARNDAAHACKILKGNCLILTVD